MPASGSYSGEMKKRLLMSIALASALLTPLIRSAEPADKALRPVQTFGWPFLDPATMETRGGTTRGSTVELDTTGKHPAWKALSDSAASGFEQDRLAILAMQGAYRTSFQFIETAGFTPDFKPSRPYFSWGTEYVHLLEDREDFISLQHTMVMYFVDQDGKTNGPMVMKHWRQDWQYEDKRIHAFKGDNTWSAVEVKAPEGTWSQSVYQVDDSPRYQTIGQWTHGPNYASWKSDRFARPLPRREFSVRDDYNVLHGEHVITLSPDGWVHEQRNRKIRRDGKRDTTVAMETGLNRYERILEPELQTASDKYWARTGTYWQAVRNTWNELFRKRDTLTLKSLHEDRKLFEYHFSYAAEMDPETSLEEQKKHAHETIMNFLQDTESAQPARY